MNLKDILRKRIVEDVLETGGGTWRILVYDATAAAILSHLFSKSELLTHNIVTANHIDEQRTNAEYPVMYFVSCDKNMSDRINKEMQDGKYSTVTVQSLIEPVGLDPRISYSVVHLNIEALEDRVFRCAPEYIADLSNVLNIKCSVNYLPQTQELARFIGRKLAELEEAPRRSSQETQNAVIVLIHRSIDLYTPLLHFFTFKSIIAEIEPDKFAEPDFSDIVWPEVRYKHIKDVPNTLKYYVSKLNKNLEQLNKKNLDTTALTRMVLDTPKNTEIKTAVEKYSNLLTEAISRYKYLKEMVEAEQSITTGYDKTGRKLKGVGADFHKILKDVNIPLIDRVRYLYVMKVKGIPMTRTEKHILRPFGFLDEDLDVDISALLLNQVKQEKHGKYKYEESRYEPVISSLINRSVNGDPIFQGQSPASPSEEERTVSLRRSMMLTRTKKTFKRLVVLYIVGGCTIEEQGLAYSLSDSLGIDMLIGSDTMINYNDFINNLKKTQKNQKK